MATGAASEAPAQSSAQKRSLPKRGRHDSSTDPVAVLTEARVALISIVRHNLLGITDAQIWIDFASGKSIMTYSPGVSPNILKILVTGGSL